MRRAVIQFCSWLTPTLESLRLLWRLGYTERESASDAGCKVPVCRIIDTVFNPGHELDRASCGKAAGLQPFGRGAPFPDLAGGAN